MDLGLLQKQVAEQIGVHPLTITNWERNATQPTVQYIPAINLFLGYECSVKAQLKPSHDPDRHSGEASQ